MKRMLFAIFAICGITLAAEESDAILKFDFGPSASPVCKGFKQVTEDTIYDKSAGYGWRKLNKKRKRRSGDNNKYDDMCRDFVRFFSSEFIVDLPNGKYVVNLWISDPRGYAGFQNYLKWGATAEGARCVSNKRWNEKSQVDFFFKDFYKKNIQRTNTVWKRCVAPLYPRTRFVVEVKDGKLNLKLTNAYINAMVIYPESMNVQGEKEIADISDQRKMQFESSWKLITTEENDIELELSDERKEKGYLLFSRNWMDKVYPETVPEAEEIDKSIKIVCSLGEREPSSFCIYPINDLRNVVVSIENLKADDGSEFASSNIEILYEKYRYEPSPVNQTYRVIGGEIIPFEKLDLGKGLTQKIWLDTYIPPNIRAGVYKGKVVVSASNHPTQKLDIAVRVLPFKLYLNKKKHNFALQHSTPRQYRNFNSGQAVWNYVEKELLFLKKYGFTMPAIGYDILTKPSFQWDKSTNKIKNYNLDGIVKFMELYKKLGGFPSPYIEYGLHHLFMQGNYKIPINHSAAGWATYKQPDYVWKALVAVVKPIKQAQTKNKWPEFQFIATGEMSNGGLDYIHYGQKFLENLRQIPGIQLQSVVISDNELKMLAPYDDICGMSTAIATPANIEFATKRTINHTLWLYQTFNRFTYGFYFHKIGATGSFKEDFNYISCTPFNSFDGSMGEFSFCTEYCLPGPNGPVPIYKTFDDREGIYDTRYLYTLERYIAKAKNSGNTKAVSQAKKSKKVLSSIMRRVNPDLTYYVNQVGFWDNSVYDKLRWRVSTEILKLKQYQ